MTRGESCLRWTANKLDTVVKLTIASVVTMAIITANIPVNTTVNNTRAATMKVAKTTTTTSSTMIRAMADILIMSKTAAVVDVETPKRTRKVSVISP